MLFHIVVVLGLLCQAISAQNDTSPMPTSALALPIEDRIRSLENNVRSLTSRLAECCDRAISFTAYGTGLQFLTSGSRVYFRGTINNEGGYYSPTYSQFRCPVNGVYYFAFTINSYLKRAGSSVIRVNAALMLDNTEIEDVLGYNSMSTGYIITSASNSAVLRCRAGQLVWVRSKYTSNASWSYLTYRRSTFSGFLLKKLPFFRRRRDVDGEEPPVSESDNPEVDENGNPVVDDGSK
eukprot:TRINITY_DN37936_c0_g1_i1.p1 TRINITY_DN37936_c0_g1~~TRINITY_DN37936_c0_g1_i1.p1  ORF type:complete len:237 (+),score=23.00 TRINITY_DN37936_c0_g1_i1:50-760(+)